MRYDIAALQSLLTTLRLEGVVATKSTPDGVDLKLSNYSTTAAMNGSAPTTVSRRWWARTPST